MIKIETGSEGWRMFLKEGKDISPEYSQYLFDRQNIIIKMVSDKVNSL